MFAIFPRDLDVLENCEPQYEEMPGWLSQTSEAKHIAELPDAARAYLDRIGELLGVPIQVVSVGHDRSQTIFATTTGLFR